MDISDRIFRIAFSKCNIFYCYLHSRSSQEASVLENCFLNDYGFNGHKNGFELLTKPSFLENTSEKKVFLGVALSSNSILPAIFNEKMNEDLEVIFNK